MTIRDPWTIDSMLAAFQEHQRRTRGTSPEVCRSYARLIRRFLERVIAEDRDLARISAQDVICFVSAATVRYRPCTVQLLATALRSFFRYLRASGWREDHLEDAVPTVPGRRYAALPRFLDEDSFRRLIASLDTSSPRALRDKAMLLCAARLGLRASEVVRLQLEDIDWRSGSVRVRTRKTGRGAVLPLPADLGRALVAYLKRGRPATQTRHVFVRHHSDGVAGPLGRSIVGVAVQMALERAGISAPIRGSNLLRHSLASSLLRRGATFKEIADLFGHRSLKTTAIYAKVDLAALREVALPWPEVTP